MQADNPKLTPEEADIQESTLKRLTKQVFMTLNNLKDVGFNKVMGKVQTLFMSYDGPTQAQIIEALKNNKDNLPESVVATVMKRGAKNPELALIMANYFMNVIGQVVQGASLYTDEATMPFYQAFIAEAMYEQFNRPQAVRT